MPVQRVLLCGIGAGVFHPAQVVFFRGLNGAIAQAFGVVARHHPLHGREKWLDEFLFLVVQILADALGHRHGRAFQLQHTQRHAVDVNHHVRALGAGLGICAFHRHLFGHTEMVIRGLLPVHQPDRDAVLTHTGQHLHAVAQQLVDLFIAVVNTFAGVAGHPVEFMQRFADQGVIHALLGQPSREQLRLDVAVVQVRLVTQIVVAQPLLEQGDDAGLGAFFDLADGAQVCSLPVSSMTEHRQSSKPPIATCASASAHADHDLQPSAINQVVANCKISVSCRCSTKRTSAWVNSAQISVYAPKRFRSFCGGAATAKRTSLGSKLRLRNRRTF